MRASPRGQTLLLLALTLLTVAVMVAMTLAIGSRVRARLESQTVADAAAYSNAVATARAFNAIGVMNRTAVSHWVALLGIQANHAWATQTAGVLDALSEAAYRLRARTTCPRSTLHLNRAVATFKHGLLSLWNKENRPYDPVTPFSRYSPRHSFAQLDRKVGVQTMQVQDAVAYLGQMQVDIRDDLLRTLRRETLAERIARSASADGRARYAVESGGRESPGWAEAYSALRQDSEAIRPLIHAAMGSRGDIFAVSGARDPKVFGARGPKRLTPPRMQKMVKDAIKYLNDRYPNRFRASVSDGTVTTYYTDVSGAATSKFRLRNTSPIGPKAATGDAWNRINLRYRTTCGKWIGEGISVTTSSQGHRKDDFPVDHHRFGHERIQLIEAPGVGGGNDVPIPDPPPGTDIPTDPGGEPIDPDDPLNPTPPAEPEPYDPGKWVQENGLEGLHDRGDPSCHARHAYWGEPRRIRATIDSRFHKMREYARGEGVHPPMLGYVFPQDFQAGARGAFGQPKLTSLLTRRERGGRDPWEMLFRFPLPGSTPQVDLAKPRERQGALASAIAYYHRRTPERQFSWQEPPNLLNPFWRATLVPADIDQRRNDPTPGEPQPPVTGVLLQKAGLLEEQQVYLRLKEAGFRGIQ